MGKIETKMMTDKVSPREVTESKYEDKKKRENIITQSLFGRFEENESFNPNRCKN